MSATARSISAVLGALVFSWWAAPACGQNATQRFTWPGDLEGPATLWVTPSTLQLFGSLGTSWAGAGPITDGGFPAQTKTTTFNNDSVNGNVRQVGKTVMKTTESSKSGRSQSEMVITGDHSYTDAKTGAPLGRQTCTAIASINVLVCPKEDGVADGHLSISLRQETTKPDGSQGSAVTVVEGVIKFVDGEDAFRTATTMDLTLTTGARSSTGSDDPAWVASIPLKHSLPRSGAPKVTLGGKENWSWAGDVPLDAFKNNAAEMLAQKTIAELGDQVERFWRSGACIELRPNPDSREVQLNEKITLEVEAVHKLDGAKVKAPIKARFSGEKSLEPLGTPRDPPAKFDYIAGPRQGDKGTIELEQTGRRGIGRTTVEYRVKGGDLLYSFSCRIDTIGTSNALLMEKARLTARPDGSFEGTIKVTVKVNVGQGVNVPGDSGLAVPRITGEHVAMAKIDARPVEDDPGAFMVTTIFKDIPMTVTYHLKDGKKKTAPARMGDWTGHARTQKIRLGTHTRTIAGVTTTTTLELTEP